jgi:hypothetical protein
LSPNQRAAAVCSSREKVWNRCEVIEHEPVVPDVGLSDVLADADLSPAPVDVHEVSEGVEGGAVIEVCRPPELLTFVEQLARLDDITGASWPSVKVS